MYSNITNGGVIIEICVESVGGNVMCDTRTAAKKVAKGFPNSYEDKLTTLKPGYYGHFHPWNGPHHPHIWYYPIP